MELKPLRDGVRSLFQERSLLEQQLRSIQEQRMSANCKLEQVNFKVCQMMEKHSKAAESLSLAIQKVDQTQLEIQKMGDLTDATRKGLERLHHSVEEERNAQATDVGEFEQVMTSLTEKFRTAPRVYADASLQEEIAEWSRWQAETKTVVDNKRLSVEELRERLQKIKGLSGNGHDELLEVSEVPEETWRLVVEMLKKERLKAAEELANNKQTLQELD